MGNRAAHQLPAFITTREPLLFDGLVLGLTAALARKEEVSRAAAIAEVSTQVTDANLLRKIWLPSLRLGLGYVQSSGTESLRMRLDCLITSSRSR